ncbi:hypothetical protein ACW5WK_02715 [Aeromonas enteropelogenes]|uniref:hypothetical protein n=1 Tax=Aeromonas enteropelogenes TaxID=29489 RepID=UPI0005AB11BA|nr:hypothetical protein [Aeromonas enteropelogenes]UBH56288.1 hypothetical protein LA341_20845 [Aeromonas enteropelogenes]
MIYAKPGDSSQQFGGKCPDGWVQMQSKRPDGDYVAKENGEWVIRVVSRGEIEQLRLAAYADPITGSDRHFNEAIRMQVMGESDHEVVRQRGIARFEEIQRQFPWPV